MTLSGIDISNLQGPPELYRHLGWYQDAQFVIAQAIPRPRPDGYIAEQLRAAKEDGKYCGLYTWLWHDPSWRMASTVEEDQRLRLATVPDDVQIDMRPFLDEEDNQSDGWQNVSIAQRKDEVLRALDVLSEWASRRGLPQAGVYWSKWFIDLLFGGDDSWLPSGTMQWLAHYTNSAGYPAPGSLIGGAVVAHQYGSDPIDMDVMLESEIVTGGGEVPDSNVDQAWQDKKDLIVTAAGELLSVADQLTAEANRKGGPRVREIRRLANPEVRARAERILA